MSPMLLSHIVAGGLSIGAGAGAAFSMKGAPAHRLFGISFCSAMTAMAVLGGYLALFTASPVAAAPPKASLAVAALTIYLVFTAWLTVRRRPGALGAGEHIAMVSVIGIAAVLALFGVAAARAGGPPAGFVPYFVFASFAIAVAASDARLIRRGGVAGAARIARHLWRMCFAWFFATSFFFLGQQRVMPIWLRGSPLLTFLALLPLITMLVWLVRIWATTAQARGSSAAFSRVLRTVAFRTRRAPCSS